MCIISSYVTTNQTLFLLCNVSTLSLTCSFKLSTFNLQPKKTTMTISCITASISIRSHYQSAHGHGLAVDSLSCGSERIFILTSLGLTIATFDPFSAFYSQHLPPLCLENGLTTQRMFLCIKERRCMNNAIGRTKTKAKNLTFATNSLNIIEV